MRYLDPASVTLYPAGGHLALASSDQVYLPLEFSTPSLEFLSAARSVLGARWRIEQRSIWFHCISSDSLPNLPRQGWKRFLLDCASFRKDDLYIHQAVELWQAMVCKTVRNEETGGIGFVGDVNGYLSSDLASGSAGILSFGQRLHEILTKGTCNLSSWGVFDLDDLLTDVVRAR